MKFSTKQLEALQKSVVDPIDNLIIANSGGLQIEVMEKRLEKLKLDILKSISINLKISRDSNSK